MGQKRYSTVIFGCGNIILGDDGFGPCVVNELNSSYSLPETAVAVDAGTGVREYLFDYLLTAEGRPEKIIILDAVDFQGKKPGDVFSIQTSAIPSKKIHDFSLHQFPTVNLLAELEEHTGISVDIVAAQVAHIPNEIAPGLSPAMKNAVPTACKTIMNILSAADQRGEQI